MFRTESGEVHVLNAYCQHLGANMGVGGSVAGSGDLESAVQRFRTDLDALQAHA